MHAETHGENAHSVKADKADKSDDKKESASSGETLTFKDSIEVSFVEGGVIADPALVLNTGEVDGVHYV